MWYGYVSSITTRFSKKLLKQNAFEELKIILKIIFPTLVLVTLERKHCTYCCRRYLYTDDIDTRLWARFNGSSASTIGWSALEVPWIGIRTFRKSWCLTLANLFSSTSLLFYFCLFACLPIGLSYKLTVLWPELGSRFRISENKLCRRWQ